MPLTLRKAPSQPQMQVAQMLYEEKLLRWKRKDEILRELKKIDPDILDEDATLLKILAINRFYSTELKAVDWMAKHIVGIMSEYRTIQDQDIEFVTKIATAPGGERRSFASKFAHFFLDESILIYDQRAEEMVNVHIAPKDRVVTEGKIYKTFCDNLTNMRNSLPFSCSYEMLDRYLWLAGICRALKRNSQAQVNQEVKTKFEDPEIKPFFEELFPYPVTLYKPRKHK